MAKSSNDKRIDYVEFSVGDIARSRDFYGKAFGWSFKDYGPSYCEFNDGRLTGGFALGGQSKAAGGPLVILYATSSTRPSAMSRRQAERSSSPPIPSRAAAASTFPIRTATSWRCGRRSEQAEGGAEPSRRLFRMVWAGRRGLMPLLAPGADIEY